MFPSLSLRPCAHSPFSVFSPALNSSSLSTKPYSLAICSTSPIAEIRQLEGSLDVAHVLQVALGEDDVDLLERALLGLGVEEVDDRDEAEVNAPEEEIGAPLDVGNHDWGHHDNGEVEKPVEARRHSVGAHSGADGVDFGRVQPWDGQPGCAEDGNVSEESDAGSFGRWSRAVVWDEAREHEDHGKSLADGAPEEELATADAVDDEPGDCSEDGIHNHVHATQEECEIVGCADGSLEQNWEVVDDCVTPAELLEELRRAT